MTIGYSVPFLSEEGVLKLDYSDGCTLLTVLKILNYALYIGKFNGMQIRSQ